ncbi:MAG: HlyC/CorC family transporter [Ruminococcaceae bacterium]|nr:HlyC/CorC family transporter [Oscillospiraceae bacterium]
MTIGMQLVLQLVLILLNSVFACAEIAVLSVSEAKLTKLEEEGNKKAKTLRKLVEEPSRFLSTIQVAITLAGFLGSAFAADNFSERLTGWIMSLNPTLPEGLIDSVSVIVITLILSYVTLILGELVPKRIAMKKPEAVALGLAGMLWGVSNAFRPIVWLLTVSMNGVLRLCGIDPNEQDEEVSEEEIRLMVDEGESKGIIAETEKEMIQNVFEFDDLTVDEFATHRTDICLLWMEDDLDAWEAEIHETRHSIYPVCGETKDDVIGVLSVKDYFRLRDQGKDVVVRDAVKAPFYVPEGIHADVLFRQMQTGRNHFAVVLDEYGGMFGIVTMNDLLEQLVGDLTDNEDHEEEVPMIVRTGEDTWDVQGICPLDDAAEEIGIELPVDKYDTVGGYVFSSYGVIPDDGTEFETEIDRLHVKVTGIQDHRIVAMTITLLPEPEEEDEEDKKSRKKSDEDEEDGKKKSRKSDEEDD